MNKVELLADYIVAKNIQYIEHKTHILKAASFTIDNKKSIIIDKSKFENSKHFFVALCHECLHCEYDVFYRLDDPLQSKDRREYKINKLLIKNIVPLDKFKLLLKQGLNKYEVSEELDVPEKIIDLAFRIYKNMGEL